MLLEKAKDDLLFAGDTAATNNFVQKVTNKFTVTKSNTESKIDSNGFRII